MLKISEMRGDQMSRFHNALYLGNVTARVQTLQDVGLYPLAYATAKNAGMDDLAQEVLEASGISEEDAGKISIPKGDLLQPPPALPSASEVNWPSVGVVESYFDRALTAAANGETMASDGHVNGGDAGSRGLDEWAADEAGMEDNKDAEVAEDAWDIAAEEPEAGPSELVDAGDAMAEDGIAESGDATGEVALGISEAALWARNSPLAADHVAAGSFETAMSLLNRQVGAVNFEPLKPLFLQSYSASKLYVQANASMPPLPVYLRRDPTQTDLRSVLPVTVRSLQSITSTDLKAAYSAFNRAKFLDCLNIFRSILHSLLLTVATSTAEENEVSFFFLYQTLTMSHNRLRHYRFAS
jgi:coatomer protein complex subunit alpha (xenin)